ncbi:hypothetical protein ACFSHT_08085 [Paraburkholderia silviterrae]|uniref:hypothetical protein n=1 Tax=Paraburkholderia silviterrae TaxID=2528715 RepID=UPI001F0D721C|nr:hypothetical protein [Paraburkholderia silviterrae]
MRLIPSNVRRSLTGTCGMLAAVLIPAALLALAPSVRAQTATDAASAGFVATNTGVVPATGAAMVPATFNVRAAPPGSDNGTGGENLSTGTLAADPGPAGDDQVLAGAGALDDQTLARQRGGAVGMVMVAAMPQLMRGSSVTLWDEIAPPAPLPIPVDTGQAAQGNIASYTRK